MTPAVRVGTRASALALTQTTTVAESLAALGEFGYELVRVSTTGDVNRASLSQIGGTGVFVAALREALLDDNCDVAVHSLKDLPTGEAEGLTVAAVPERADIRDALCARDGLTLAGLPEGSSVGTGSPRRAAQLRAARPDLSIIDIRGNVDTRLARVAGLVDGGPGDLDAVVLAAAGLTRLGRQGLITEYLATELMLPAPGQGALAVECRSDDAGASVFAQALRQYDHLPTRLAVTAERAVLRRLEAGCTAPIGAHATVTDDVLTLEAVVCSADGGRLLRRTEITADLSVGGATSAGVVLAEELLANGAAEIAGLSADL
ncbi:hydroxymethylbilane synthase [Arthrobacter parietis]|uniref:Porphobilinogen deaminase n=1 Tax=Arthrobacter parietis TaxID=271434 RepID=A0ABP5MG55_9MICC